VRRFHAMHRALVFLGLTFIGYCVPSKPPAPAPPPKAIATPEETCKRVAQISADKFSADDVAVCIDKMVAVQKTEPATYTCIAGCIENAKAEVEAEPCLKTCVPDQAKVASNDPEGEALRNLGSIETGSKNMFQQETDLSETGIGPFVHTFCPTGKPVPAVLPAAGEKTKVEPAEWDAATWRCLKFSIHEPQLFQYSYEHNGKTGVESGYVATARRRLTTGKIRTYRLAGRGSPTGDAVRISLSQADE
jgi:hypothetical protein